MASVWGGDSPSVAWGQNSWASNTVTQSLTGQSLTSSLGTLDYAQATDGWGRVEYGNAGWGVTYSVALSGLGLTSSLGTATGEQEIPVDITGIGLTSSLGTAVHGIGVPISTAGVGTTAVGSLTEVSTNAGWGRDSWGPQRLG